MSDMADALKYMMLNSTYGRFGQSRPSPKFYVNQSIYDADLKAGY